MMKCIYKCMYCGKEINQSNQPVLCFTAKDTDGSSYFVCETCFINKVEEIILRNKENKDEE